MSLPPDGLLSTQERELLRDSIRRLLRERWQLAWANLESADAPEGIAFVRELTDLGLQGLGHVNGSGGSTELLLALEELGRASCPADLHSAAIAEEASDSDEELLDLIVGAPTAPACVFAEEGYVKEEGGRLTGLIPAIEWMPGLSHVLVLLPSASVHLVRLRQPGVMLHPQSAMGGIPAVAVELNAASIEHSASPAPSALPRALSLARGAACARSLGAARRAFELVLAYVRERTQFGKKIGAFQAIQHRLSNCFMTIEGIGELLSFSAQLRDNRDANWAFLMDCAFAHAADALPGAMLDIQHTFGAIGYAEEHEAPRHFRRVHWDVLAVGGRDCARRAINDRILANRGMPERPVEAAAANFRKEVRDWLSVNWTDEDRLKQKDESLYLRDRNREFARRVGAQGWAALTWPVAFGGLARPVAHQLVLAEEMERIGAPRFGAPIHAAAIMAFGTPQQQQEHLGRIRSGDGIYGIAYSEPDSGSDLASLRTSAIRTPDGWELSGQKIWTTTYWGEHMWVLARTDPAASPPHAGLSLFLMRTDAPGITIVPADTMYGGKFASIFFDQVRLPSEALLGSPNEAWKILTLALAVERAVIGGGILGKVLESFDELVGFVLRAPLQDRTSDLLGAFGARLAIGQALAERSARAVDEGGSGLVEAAVCKVFCSELMEHFFEDALQWGGRNWALSEGGQSAVSAGRFEQRLRHSMMHVISGGTNDIQRNVIAQRGLALPRH
jgi:alkylation response protein AidB-like acyl-CoA dehydrogenase